MRCDHCDHDNGLLTIRCRKCARMTSIWDVLLVLAGTLLAVLALLFYEHVLADFLPVTW